MDGHMPIKKPQNKKGFYVDINESEIMIMIAREDGAGIFQIYESLKRKKSILNKLKELRDWVDNLIKFLENKDVGDKN